MALAPGVDLALLLARSVLALRPLIDALPRPLHLPLALAQGGEAAPLQACLDAVCRGLPAPRLTLGETPADPGARLFARVLSEGLESALASLDEARPAWPSVEAFERSTRRALADPGEGRPEPVHLSSFDGTPLRAYALGERSRPAVVLVPPCGMPVGLSLAWLHFLARDAYVLTWESRGLFLADAAFDRRGRDVSAQAADLVAVMDRFGVASAHALGMCGGAVLALAAAAAWPARVHSLSLWHGDYELGAGGPKTDHQHDLGSLLAMAAESRESAAAVRGAMCHALAGKPLPQPAAHVLYPWANAELTHRYGLLNGSIMSFEVEALLPRVRQPVAVITSQDDGTAHPEGSRRVAARLADATLYVEPHGDHLSVFRAEANVRELARRVLRAGAASHPEPAVC
ncbi:MAG TPA: alpha/beta hydrolase [Thermoanaerobaculia bacterium]|nr:alpha/beta hydrolase [Thermoanaerobaculia bacterium]